MFRNTSLPSRLVRCAWACVAVTVLVPSNSAIVIRHDRDDARHLALGERFPAAVTVLPDGAGALIAPDWVLTAAHVAREVADRNPRVRVRGREYPVGKVFVHPEWRDHGPHDVGLLRLETPVGDVRPVNLYEGTDEVGRVATFVGSGDTGTGRTGPRAADGKVRGATNRVESADENWVYFTFDEGDAATDLEGVSGPGDSGGPALVEIDGTWYTIGVSVFSDGRGDGPGRYGVGEGYARVSTHRDWIDGVVSGHNPTGEIPVGESGEAAALQGPAASSSLPDSPEGNLVRRYVETYNRDDPEAMIAFAEAHFAPSYRASRTDAEHLDVYRRLYDDHFGAIEVDRVIGAANDEVTVLFRTERGPMAEFRFAIETEDRPRISGIRVAIVEISGGP